jgi:polyisoprenoid-binding protein YceI
MTYRSTGLHWDGDDLVVDGELTLRGITRQVPLTVELTGFGRDLYGGTRAGFSATAKINRKDFGIDTDMPLDGGGVVIGETVQISLDIQAVLRNS